MSGLIKVHYTLPEPIDGCAGESMWAWFTADGVKAYNEDEEGTEYVGLLRNDSVLSDMRYNCPIKVRMMGTMKPEIIEWGNHLIWSDHE